MVLCRIYIVLPTRYENNGAGKGKSGKQTPDSMIYAGPVSVNGCYSEDKMSSNEQKLVEVSDRPSRKEAEEAVVTLIRWAGDDPKRPGLLDTPRRVVNAFEEFFSGYNQDPEEVLSRTFEDVERYDEMVMLRGIHFESHCEHHIVRIKGMAHVAYFPDRKIVGLSKLARVVDIFSRRLQTQEQMTVQIAESITNVMQPKGVAVMIEAEHECMSCRGVRKQGVKTVTTKMTGLFSKDLTYKQEFLTMVRHGESIG